jgi:hypothetical protein
MRKTLRPLDFLLPCLLALAHVWVCFGSFRPDGNGWSGILAFIVDLPFSLALAELSNVFSLNMQAVFLIGGTIWWFCLGFLISLLIVWVCGFLARLSSGPSPPD